MEGKFIINVIMRSFQFLWALLVMALSGNMIASSWSGENSSPAIVGYAMFCAAFGMLCLFLLFPATFKESLGGHPALPFTLDLLNNIFWFCGAIAFAAELTANPCNDGYFLATNKITNSGPDEGKMCREGQATTAFLWFGWAAFLISNVITGMALTGGMSYRPRTRGPQMSKV